jgi:TetR/AcrR family transcriptional regulator, transcriptional repressor of bet genes
MPKSVNLDAKRAEFVDAAWRVIRKEGFRAATLRRVAAEARCTTGALTHYFSDREALLLDALKRAHGAAAERMHATGRALASAPRRLEAVMLEALPLDAKRLDEWKTRLAFWDAASESELLRRENLKRFNEWSEFLHQWLAPLVPNVKARRREVMLIAALVDGLAMRLLTQCRSAEQLRAAAPEIVAAVRAHVEAMRTRYA